MSMTTAQMLLIGVCVYLMVGAIVALIFEYKDEDDDSI